MRSIARTVLERTPPRTAHTKRLLLAHNGSPQGLRSWSPMHRYFARGTFVAFRRVADGLLVELHVPLLKADR